MTATAATATAIMGFRERGGAEGIAPVVDAALGPAAGAASSARTNSATLANRSAGTFDSAFATAASTLADTVGRTVRTCITGSVSSLAMTACTVFPVIGGSPTSISYSTDASEYRSLRASTVRSPVACSGLM